MSTPLRCAPLVTSRSETLMLWVRLPNSFAALSWKSAIRRVYDALGGEWARTWELAGLNSTTSASGTRGTRRRYKLVNDQMTGRGNRSEPVL